MLKLMAPALVVYDQQLYRALPVVKLMHLAVVVMMHNYVDDS
jgi:hypothetical protein